MTTSPPTPDVVPDVAPDVAAPALSVVQSQPGGPYARRTVRALAVLALVIAVTWLALTPPGWLGKADAVGYAICHRIAERTFHIHQRPLPLCARCTGIYLGVMSGLGLFIARGRARAGRLPPLRVLAVLGGLLLVYGFDGLNSYLSFFEFYRPVYQPHNTLRLLTGMSFGLLLITLLLPVLNMTLWREPARDAPLRDLRELAVLLALGGAVALAVLSEQAVVLYPAAALSVLGVVLMFMVVGGVGFLTVTRRENTLNRWRELAIPALAGLIFALSVIGLIDLARYVVTGSWEGFTF